MLILAVKSQLQCKLVDSFCINTCECIPVDFLVTRSKYIRYGIVHRPPNTSFEDSMTVFNKLFAYLSNCKLFTLIGNFNLPCINWSSLISTTVVGREFPLPYALSRVHHNVWLFQPGSKIL